MLFPLSAENIDTLAKALIRAKKIGSARGLSLSLEGDIADLVILQAIVDGVDVPFSERDMICLAYAFGSVFLANGPFDWALSKQEGFADDICVRMDGFELEFSPVGYVLKRWDEGERIDFPKAYSDIRARLFELSLGAART